MSSNVTSIIDLLALLDRSRLTPRDVRILDCVRHHPGCCGKDLVTYLKLPGRSSVQANIPKLIRWGYLEDRRRREGNAIPSQLHLTMEGLEYILDLVP